MNDNVNDNVQFVRSQIARKLDYNIPYYATRNDAGSAITDMDNFPYNRFFRGVYYEPKPVVFEREAGYRPLNNPCYRKQVLATSNPARYCWEYPCSTLFPCVPSLEEEKPRCYIVSP